MANVRAFRNINTRLPMSLQVEALGTMLDKAEQLVEQAQQACSLLQVRPDHLGPLTGHHSWLGQWYSV